MATRRSFLKSSGAACACLVSGSAIALLESCQSIRSISAEEKDKKIVVDKSTLDGNPVVIRSASLPGPVLLSRSSATGYNAVLMVCTHKQCVLRPEGPVLVCPCHGSEFSRTGEVLREPARDRLHQYVVTDSGNAVIISIL